MQDFYLKFESQEQAKSILFDGESPNYSNIDEIGTVHEPTGQMIETENGEIPEMLPIEGWHVNVRAVEGEDTEVLNPFVVQPSPSRRRWAAVSLTTSVPHIVTIRQAKLALLQSGLLDAVETVMQQADRKTQIEWEYAHEFRRSWPALLQMQPLLNLTDEQIDNLFKLASTL
jgi:hypothetical protein